MVAISEINLPLRNSPEVLEVFPDHCPSYPYTFTQVIDTDKSILSGGIYIPFKEMQLCVMKYEITPEGTTVLIGQALANDKRDVVKDFIYASDGGRFVTYSPLEFNDKNRRVRSALSKQGLLEEKELPECIDFDATVRLLLSQVERREPTKPKMILND